MLVADGEALKCTVKTAETHQEEDYGHTDDPQVRQRANRAHVNG
jgi:hypothetical protein